MSRSHSTSRLIHIFVPLAAALLITHPPIAFSQTKEHPAASEATSPDKTIAGQVIDASGHPVEKATVWFFLHTTPFRFADTTTDADGFFELPAPEHYPESSTKTFSWELCVHADNLGIGRVRSLSSESHTNYNVGKVKLRPVETLEIKIQAPDGSPVKDVSVQPFTFPPAKYVTDANGIVKFPQFSRGSRSQTWIESKTFGTISLRRLNDTGEDNPVIKLPEPGRIEGRLTGDNAESVRNVPLTLLTRARIGNYDLTSSAQVTSDEQGAFRVPAIAGIGPLELLGPPAENTTAKPQLTGDHYVVAGETLTLEIPVVSLVKITGQVVDETNGQPLPNVEVTLVPPNLLRHIKTSTDDEGRFQSKVLPGRLIVHTYFENKDFVQSGPADNRTFEIPTDAKSFEVPVIKVEKTVPLTGQLVDATGEPLHRHFVSASHEEENRGYDSVTTDRKGNFTLHVPASRADKISIQVRDNKNPHWVTTVIQKDPLIVQFAEGGFPKQFEMERNKKPDVLLTGRVLHEGKPVAGTKLEITRLMPVDERGNNFHHRDETTVTTDDQGNYKLPGLKADDQYLIKVNPPFKAVDPEWKHQSPYIPKVPSTAHGEVKLPDMHLVKLTQTVAGKVLAPDGKPIAGAHVSARLSDGKGTLSRVDRSLPPPWTDTDAKGQFSLKFLPDVPITLNAYIRPKSGNHIRFPANVEVKRNQQDIIIRLDPDLLNDEEESL